MKVYEWTKGNFLHMLSDLLETKPIHTGEWQSMNTGTSKAHRTHELLDVTLHMEKIPLTVRDLIETLNPDMPWAEDHFLERVSGIPHNPPPSHVSWPYAIRDNGDHTTEAGRFDHTYPERFWPKRAGLSCPTPEECMSTCDGAHRTHKGIAFAYGDLGDVVNLLARSPLTRQAYLPVWFPEDTGTVVSQRVPCSLGYHFMIRDGYLTTRYYIRSCDVHRHLINDMYFACRLTQWLANQVNEVWHVTGIREDHPFATPVVPGSLIMHITSLHAFTGDVPKLEKRINDAAKS